MRETMHCPTAARQWLASPLGSALLRQESRVVEDAFDGIFGVQCVQIGQWGSDKLFLKHARTQRTALFDSGFDTAAADLTTAAAIGELHRLPIASDCIDCVLLPHTLDFSDRRHAVLREAQRVLRKDGHLVILGFKTGGLWGMRRLVPGAELPPAATHLVSERRLRDWLQLLDFRIYGVTRYFFRWPLPGIRGDTSPAWEQRGQRFWPELAACYMLTAQKRVSTLTPVRPRWRRKPKVVAGLASSSNRVSRIRFEQNH